MREGDRGAPLEVAGDAALGETLLEPGTRDLRAVVGPFAFLARLVDKRLALVLNRGQVEEDVVGRLDDGRRVADLAAGVDQLGCVQELATAIALVSTCILRAACVRKTTAI